MKTEEIKIVDVNNLAKNALEDVIAWRRDLHQIPEIGIDLPKTSSYIAKQLDSLGISYEVGVGLDSAIVGFIKGGKGEGKTIALRADMDALPIKEESGLSFASINGNMHACGHDAHVAILLGAAKVLNDMKNELSGRIILLFQPAEEISQGAEPMIQAGALEGVDAVLGIHVGSISEEAQAGMALFSKGPMMACLDRWTMKIKGRGSHGAAPHNSHDPIFMTGNIINTIQTIISREINPVDPGLISIGKITGGTSYNVIPDYVELEGTARAIKEETREYIAKRIGEIAELVAKASKGNVEYNYIFGAPPLINDEKFTVDVMESAKKVLGEENIKLMENPVMVGEDFSCYLKEVPGTFVFLSTPLEIDGVMHPHHNSKFALDEQYFNRGVALFVQSTLDFFNSN